MTERRRQFKPEFKAHIVIDLLTGTTTMAKACQKYHLKQQVVSRWKADFLERAPEVFAGNAQHEADQERIADPERLVGRLTRVVPRRARPNGWRSFALAAGILIVLGPRYHPLLWRSPPCFQSYSR